MSESEGLDAAPNVGDVGDDGEDRGNCHNRGCSNIRTGNHSGEIHREGGEECEANEAGVCASFLRAEHLNGDIVADKACEEFDCHLAAARDKCGLRCDPEEDRADQCSHHDTNEDEAVELEDRALAENRLGEEVFESGLVHVLREGGNRRGGNHHEKKNKKGPVPQGLGSTSPSVSGGR